MLIFPAIDLRDGKCVRLHQGNYAQETIYGEDPAQVAADFEAQGAKFLHVVDLDGAREGSPQNLEAIRAIRRAIQIPMQVGGGIRDEASMDALLALGVNRVILGSRIARDLDWAAEILPRYGEQVVIGIDARDGLVAVSGWQKTENVRATELARKLSNLGGKRVIFTDISRDGTLAGPNLPTLQAMIDEGGMPVVASGGVGTLDDLRTLSRLPIEGVIVGKALYERRFTLSEAVSLGA
jgi:phosphoribosylformimino-5-aminoimidazole carboxamide ribotide isomerase